MDVAIKMLIVLVIILGAMFVVEQIHTKENVNFAEQVAKEAIMLAEKERYVSPQVKAKIMEMLDDKFSEIQIDGTAQPVELGEKVYLILTVEKRNLYGGSILKKRFVEEGVAK